MKCIRCGTELKDSSVFCPDCSKVTSVPLSSSPYMSRKIVIPKRKPPQTVKKAEPKKPDPKKSRGSRWILLSAILLLLTALMLLQGAYTYREKEAYAAEVARLQAVEDECVRLTDKLRQAESSVTALEEEVKALGSDAYLRAREDLKQAEEEITRLTGELTRAQQSVADLEAQLELLREKTDFFDTYIVFLQEDGTEVFHSYDCETFTRHGYKAYNKQQALYLGYQPCPLCQ